MLPVIAHIKRKMRITIEDQEDKTMKKISNAIIADNMVILLAFFKWLLRTHGKRLQ